MTDTVESQLHIMKSKECARVLAEMRERFRYRCHQTLVMFDFGDGGAMAIRSSLKAHHLLVTLEKLAAKLETGMHFGVLPDPLCAEGMPDPDVFLASFQHVRTSMLPGNGFFFFLGAGEHVMYGSNAERASVIEFIRTDLIPPLRAQLSSN